MLKILGVGLVIGGCGLAGLALAHHVGQRPLQLRSLQSALLMLDSEIGYVAAPLPEVLERISNRVPEPSRSLFKMVRHGLQRSDGNTASEVWRYALKNWSAATHLKNEDVEVLATLGQGLGALSREDQLRHLRLAMDYLRAQEQLAEGERVKQERMWRTMGFLLGAALVIIAW